ncbi:hypothetical protein H6F89_33365 [Cyanobacteria bacterium FACHB-63]|nr:hypothetical protein [Cyanobacteria bacterium FACHB-63]
MDRSAVDTWVSRLGISHHFGVVDRPSPRELGKLTSFSGSVQKCAIALDFGQVAFETDTGTNRFR